MSSLLLKFSATIGWGSLTAVLVVLLVLAFAYIKSPKGTVFFLKIAGCILAFVVLPVSAVFSGIKVNSYYSASGGIFGKIRENLNLNKGKTTTDTFEISELNLRLDENKEYSATITVNIEEQESVLKLDSQKQYALEINGTPTNNNFCAGTGDSLSISADYIYTFKDFIRTEIVKDTLHIAFQINNKFISCRVSSKGGAVAQKMWTMYCQKNDLKIKFVETTYKKPSLPSVGDGEVEEYCALDFLDSTGQVIRKICKKGEVFDDVPEVSRSIKYRTDSVYSLQTDSWVVQSVLYGEEPDVFDFTQPISQDYAFVPKCFSRFCLALISDNLGEIFLEESMIYYSETLLGIPEQWVNGAKFGSVSDLEVETKYYPLTQESIVSLKKGTEYLFEATNVLDYDVYYSTLGACYFVFKPTFEFQNKTARLAFKGVWH